MSHRGKRSAILLAGLSILVMALAAWSMKDSILEAWYIHKIETAENKNDVEAYGTKLRAIASARTMPRLMRLLQDRREDVLGDDGKLKDAFFNTVAAIGPEGVAVILRGIDEETLGKVQEPLYWADGGREAVLEALRHPNPLVRRRAIGCQSTHVSIYDALRNGYTFSQTSDNEDGEFIKAVLDLLDDGDRAVRAAAAARLAKPFHGKRTVRREIRASLRDPDVRIRREAASALDFDGARMALPELIAGLKDPDGEVRSAAVRALGFSGTEEAMVALTDAIEVPGAIRSIRDLLYEPEIPPPAIDRAVEAILQVLDGSDSGARGTVLDGLRHLHRIPGGWTEGEIERLLEKAGANKAAAVRFSLDLKATALLEIPLLIDLLDEPDPVVCFAAWALKIHGVGATPAVPNLIAAIKNDGYADYHVIRTLGNLAPTSPLARKALVGILNDKNKWCRVLAAQALESSASDPEVLTALIGVVEDPKIPPMLLGAAASALAGAGPALRDHLPKLMEILEKTSRRRLDNNQFSRSDHEIYKIEDGIIDAIVGLGPAAMEALPFLKKTLPKKFRYARAILAIDPKEAPEVLKTLIEAVRNGNATWNGCVRTFAEVGSAALPAAPFLVDGLAYDDAFERPLLTIGAPVVPFLTAALAQDDLVLRARIAKVLGKMGAAAAGAIPALRTVLEDPDEEVHREAEKALRRIDAEENPQGR